MNHSQLSLNHNKTRTNHFINNQIVNSNDIPHRFMEVQEEKPNLELVNKRVS